MQSNSDANEELGAVSHMDANDLGKINALYSCTNAPTCKLAITSLPLNAGCKPRAYTRGEGWWGWVVLENIFIRGGSPPSMYPFIYLQTDYYHSYS